MEIYVTEKEIGAQRLTWQRPQRHSQDFNPGCSLFMHTFLFLLLLLLNYPSNYVTLWKSRENKIETCVTQQRWDSYSTEALTCLFQSSTWGINWSLTAFLNDSILVYITLSPFSLDIAAFPCSNLITQISRTWLALRPKF